MEVFAHKAKEMDSEVIIVGETPTSANFMFINNAVARKSLGYLKAKHFEELTHDNIEKAMHTNMPCRHEEVPAAQVAKLAEEAKAFDSEKVKVYLDISTNLPALEALLTGLGTPDTEVWVVCGFSEVKDKKPLFTYLGNTAARVFCVSNDHFLLTKAEALHA